MNIFIHQRRSKFARMCGVVAGAWMLAACSDPLDDFGALNDRIRAYYDAEAAGDWETVYGMRVKDFRWSVARDYFITAMREDAEGWELLDYKVLEAEETLNNVRVRLKFRYRVTAQDHAWARLVADRDGIVELEDVASWVFEDDEWLCEHAGVRAHLPMSDSLN